MKKLFGLLIFIFIMAQTSAWAELQPIPVTVKLPEKYTQEYIDSLA